MKPSADGGQAGDGSAGDGAPLAGDGSAGDGGAVKVRGMAEALARVPGVTAVTLGGSRARGKHHDNSDWDIGVYYREPLDVAGLGALAAELVGGPVEIAPPGGWGPWVPG